MRHVVGDSSKARRVLGFSIAVNFATGVRRFAAEPVRVSVTG